MLPVKESVPHVPPASPGSAHVDRLNALWKLSVQPGLSDAERIRAMLDMAAKVLDMDLVVLGEFGERYTARYVCDRLGQFPEGTVLMVEEALCHAVHRTREPGHIADLSQDPLYGNHELVNK